MEKKVIRRYFRSEETLAQIATDFKFLFRMVNRSGGEFSIQLREDYFNIYYKGNSLAKVTPSRNRRYRIEIHKKFAKDMMCEALGEYVSQEPRMGRGGYVRFIVAANRLHQFLQKKHIVRLSRNIKKRNYGEEISLEQVLITDNPPTEKFIIIDRQVADHETRAQMDLLALKRNSVNGPFHFLVIEVKLGWNPELQGKVGKQLSGYLGHIRSHIRDYIDCYKENYRQKKQLGLLCDRLPDEINIGEEPVEGLVVVGGYSQLAKESLKSLRAQWPHIKVRHLKMSLY